MAELMTEKRKVYVVTIFLKDQDEEGEPLNWSSPSEEYFAGTYEEAEKLRDKFLAGEDEYYGDLIEDCWISDEPEEREFYTRLLDKYTDKEVVQSGDGEKQQKEAERNKEAASEGKTKPVITADGLKTSNAAKVAREAAEPQQEQQKKNIGQER